MKKDEWRAMGFPPGGHVSKMGNLGHGRLVPVAGGRSGWTDSEANTAFPRAAGSHKEPQAGAGVLRLQCPWPLRLSQPLPEPKPSSSVARVTALPRVEVLKEAPQVHGGELRRGVLLFPPAPRTAKPAPHSGFMLPTAASSPTPPSGETRATN